MRRRAHPAATRRACPRRAALLQRERQRFVPRPHPSESPGQGCTAGRCKRRAGLARQPARLQLRRCSLEHVKGSESSRACEEQEEGAPCGAGRAGGAMASVKVAVRVRPLDRRLSSFPHPSCLHDTRLPTSLIQTCAI
uniref:Uncharacterized protein n=1 Tax=Sphaerodactylus townsendi TaxID=933632 RepID=A0ACB8GEE4_9SAUR